MLLGISKRGNRYLRALIIHGARSRLRCSPQERSAQRVDWSIQRTRGPNITVIALANKDARVGMSFLTRTKGYRMPAA